MTNSKKLEVSEGVEAVDTGDTIQLVCVPTAIFIAAQAAVDAYDSGDFQRQGVAINVLEAALLNAGFNGEHKP